MEDVSLSHIHDYQLEEILKITSESIKIELDILKTAVDYDKTNTIMRESIEEIIKIQKLKKQVSNELIKRLTEKCDSNFHGREFRRRSLDTRTF